jgi:16S rRNA (guanine1516-N2)-methyltransferase
MFVSKNRTARPKKELWALARLVRDDDDGASLLDAALATGCRRVVVKRPDNGAPLEASDGRPPDVQFRGKTVRFDVYLQPDAAPAVSA